MPNHEHKEEETERSHPSSRQMPGKKQSSDVNYYHDCLYNPLSDSSHCRNWMTYAVRATGFFQDTEYFLQLPVVCG